MRAFKQLLRRLDDLHGLPFAKLAPAVGITWKSGGAVRNKGFAGHVVQAALGAPTDNSPRRDLVAFGLEIKTIPLRVDLTVREATKIASLNYQHLLDSAWRTSHVYQKMRTTLFVPVVKRDTEAWQDWYMCGSFIWLPTEEEDEQLQRDYEAVRGLVQQGKLSALTSRRYPEGPCRNLLPRPGGRDADDAQTFRLGGQIVAAERRAWFLHSHFVQSLVDANLDAPDLR
jgi:DNA mismatch repair protein MutH